MHHYKQKMQWMSVFLLMFVLLSAPSRAHAELSCDGFHALVDYIKNNHFYTFTPEEYAAHYNAGLSFAVQQLNTAAALTAEEIKTLSAVGEVTAESYQNCTDSERIVSAFIDHSQHQVTLGRVLSLQVKGLVQMMDPHSEYLLTEEWYGATLVANSASLGIKIAYNNGVPQVTAVYPDGPADNVLQVGDELVAVTAPGEVERQSLQGLKRYEVLQFLSGDDGDEFILSIKRQNKSESHVVAMNDKPGSAVGEARILDDNVTGYIKLIDFHEGAVADFAAALRALSQAGARALVLDLRNNPGGRVQEAIEILDYLLDLGVVVNYVDHAGTVLPQRLSHPGMTSNMPVAVLLNRFSASAAELTSLALQDYQRAILIGEPTFGKGTAQITLSPESLQDLVDESIDGALRLTAFQYFGAAGTSPQRQRLAPHLVVRHEQQEKIWQQQAAEYGRLGKVWISGEADFATALPAKTINAKFDPGTIPNNSIDKILGRLLLFSGFKPPLVQDPQLAKAIEVLQHYQSSCHSFHEQQCSFNAMDKVAAARPQI